MGKNKTSRKLRQPFETLGFMLLRGIIPILPRGGVVALARWVGRLSWWLPTKEKKVGLKNLNAVYGDTKTDAEKRYILTRSFETFCQTMLDVFWFSHQPEKRIRKFVTTHQNATSDCFFSEKAHVCITAHLGSWEMLGQAMAFEGVSLASIAAPLKNPIVDRIVVRQRERTGQTIIPREGALRTLIARFRNHGKAAFVLDQKTNVSNGGVVINLLGLPMPVSSAPAAMAYRTGTEIIFGFCKPEPGGHYHAYFTKTIQPPPFDKEADTDEIVRTLTQQIVDEVSHQIHQHPEYWLWSYKHWREKARPGYPSNYPTY